MKRSPWAIWRPVDQELCQRTGFNRIDLARIRQRLHNDWSILTCQDKKRLAEGGTAPRFSYLSHKLREVLTPAGQWEAWLNYIGHDERDIREMERGEYPISPYVIRIYSALFGIKVNFLLFGSAPEVDEAGCSIDVWPMVSSRSMVHIGT